MAASTATRRKGPLALDQGVHVAVLVVVHSAALSLTVAGFATWGNTVNILTAAAGLGILALGQAVVVIARGLDLSVVVIYGMTAQLVAFLLRDGMGEMTALLVGLIVAIAMGLVNGLLVAYVDIPPIFVTLGRV